MKLRILTALLVLLPISAMAQQRLSVDVTTVQVSQGKKVTTSRSLYLHPDGRLVVEQHAPLHLVSLTNRLGEMRIYDPKNNQVAAINNREMGSDKEMVSIFASGDYADMALNDYGFTQSDVRNEDGLIIKTFEAVKSAGGVHSVELVLQNHVPICMIYYDGGGNVMRKVYFSRYEYGRIPMPMRITEIEYTSPQDSLVRLSTYTNLLTGREASSEMFDFQIPADAVRNDVDLNNILQQQ